MKKIIIAIVFLISLSANAQDTIKVFNKIVDYGLPTRIDYKCYIIRTGSSLDTVCLEKGKGTGQGFGEKDSIRIQELDILFQKTFDELNKATIELDKIKAENPQIKLLETQIIKLQSYLELIQYIKKQELKY